MSQNSNKTMCIRLAVFHLTRSMTLALREARIWQCMLRLCVWLSRATVDVLLNRLHLSIENKMMSCSIDSCKYQ